LFEGELFVPGFPEGARDLGSCDVRDSQGKRQHLTDNEGLHAACTNSPKLINQLLQPDVAQQRSASASAAAPTAGAGFEGLGTGLAGATVDSAPPDPNLTVGPNHVVEIVNEQIAVFSKTGAVLMAPKNTNTVWSGFGGGCQTNNDGDATVKYDRAADRWIVSQFSVSTTPYLQCVAVSTSGDPTGSYNRYAFQYSNFPDYPKLAVWPDAYYTTFNMFSGNTFAGGKVCAYDRASMIAGTGASQQCFDISTDGGLLASDLDGATPPPPGSPNYVLAFGTSSLRMWKFHVDWANPSQSTLTGPTVIPVAAFTAACNGGGTCIPQSGTNNKLDSLADRLMYRLAYRNFGDHESLVVNHSVTTNNNRVGVRWYELRAPGATPVVYQQSTFAPDTSNYRWMGSIAMDANGNMALGYSISSSTTRPSIAYTGRLATDAVNTMQAETTLFTGTGSQTGGLHRWGDYTSMAIDPSDDCTFWYVNEYLSANGSFNWHTRIGSFKFPSCSAAPPVVGDFLIGISPSTGTVPQVGGGSASYTLTVTDRGGAGETVDLTMTALGAGLSASGVPASLSVPANGSASATLIITDDGTAAPGTTSFTVTGNNSAASITHTVNGSFSVTPPPPPNLFTNPGFETGNTSGWNQTGSVAVVGGGHSGSFSAQVGSTGPFNGDSTVYQDIAVPAGGATLTFWVKRTCTDTITYDWQRAQIRNTSNTVLATIFNTCTTDSSWTQVSYSLASYANQTIRVTFLAHDDNWSSPPDPTYMLVDDVSAQ
jgi:hypothetical protein